MHGLGVCVCVAFDFDSLAFQLLFIINAISLYCKRVSNCRVALQPLSNALFRNGTEDTAKQTHRDWATCEFCFSIYSWTKSQKSRRNIKNHERRRKKSNSIHRETTVKRNEWILCVWKSLEKSFSDERLMRWNMKITKIHEKKITSIK